MRKSLESGSIFKQGGGISISIDNIRGDVEIHHEYTAETGKEPSPEKPKSALLWDRIFGSSGGSLFKTIVLILILFEESIERFAIESLLILIMLLSITIFVRHKISKSKT